MKTLGRKIANIIVLILFFTAVVVLILKSRGSTITFEKTFGGELEDNGKCVRQTTDGGYILAGRTKSFGAGNYDMYLVKTGEKGNKLWERTFGANGLEAASCVSQTTDGGYVISGTSQIAGTREYAMYLIKTDENGSVLWEKTFGKSINEVGSFVLETSDGGYALIGTTKSFGVEKDGVYLAKLDKSGNLLWEKTYDHSSNEWGLTVRQASDGGYIIIGRTDSFGAGWFDMYLIKTDENGEMLWEKAYGGLDDDEGLDVFQTSDGGYMLFGRTDSFVSKRGRRDIYLVKTDENGEMLWYKTFEVMGDSIQKTIDGGYILLGTIKAAPSSSIAESLKVTDSNKKNVQAGKPNYNMIIIKIDGSGNEKWSKTYGGDGDEKAGTIQQTADGGYIMLGSTKSSGMGGFDLYLVKTDDDGEMTLW